MSKKILCVYATRQIDSNLFMSSTKFDGLQQCGYTVDCLFCGTEKVCGQFNERYGHYFRNVMTIPLKESYFAKKMRTSERGKILYTFYREFIMDVYCPPYSKTEIQKLVQDNYDTILTFIPTALAGLLAYDVKQYFLPNAKLIQFWSDPISMGRCDTIYDIPKSRWQHIRVEKKLLKLGDKMVFCWPLFCDSMKKQYPEYANKMSWGDTGYVKHEKANYKPNNSKVTIGSFGAYQLRVRNMLPLLESLKNFPEVQFVIRGDSDIYIDPAKYPNLDIKPGRVPIEEIEELEANCDILLSLAGRSGLTVPSGKTFYYGDWNKPILYISDGYNSEYTMKYMRDLGRYDVCENTVESITEGIKTCIQKLDGYQVEIPERIQPSVIARKLIEE